MAVYCVHFILTLAAGRLHYLHGVGHSCSLSLFLSPLMGAEEMWWADSNPVPLPGLADKLCAADGYHLKAPHMSATHAASYLLTSPSTALPLAPQWQPGSGYLLDFTYRVRACVSGVCIVWLTHSRCRPPVRARVMY